VRLVLTVQKSPTVTFYPTKVALLKKDGYQARRGLLDIRSIV
jgi:hypothetical protein